MTTDAEITSRVYRLLGLGVRSRGAVVGVKQVREAARRNTLIFAVVASDASANSRDKIVPLMQARRVKFMDVPSAAALGAAVGRDQTAVVGIIDPQLAAGVRTLASARGTRTIQEDV